MRTARPFIHVAKALLCVSIATIGHIGQPANSQVLTNPEPVSLELPPMLVVKIDSDENVYINEQLVIQGIPLTLDNQLSRTLIDFITSNRCGLVVLTASTNTRYISVAEMIDLFRRVGVTRTALGFPLGSSDKALTPISAIVELNQLSPPTIGSLDPTECSKQPFELPRDSSTPLPDSSSESLSLPPPVTPTVSPSF